MEISEEKINQDDSSKEIHDFKASQKSKISMNSQESLNSLNSANDFPSALNTNEEVVFAARDLSDNQSLPFNSPEKEHIDFYSFERKEDSPEKGVGEISKNDQDEEKDEESVFILVYNPNLVAK